MRAAVLEDLMPPRSKTSVSRKSERLFSVLLLLLALTVLLAGRFSASGFQSWFMALPFQSPLDILLLLLSVLAAMMIHELGHLVASLLVRFKILGASLGPLQIQILHGTWKLSCSRHSSVSASISAAPATLNHWRFAMMAVITAGPMANLLSLIAATHLHYRGHVPAFCDAAFVQVSVLLLLLGLVPTPPYARAQNDARMLLDLALKNKRYEEMELNVLLTQQLLCGVRAQDYPADLVARLAGWRGRTESQASFGQALVRWALEHEQIDLAEAWDDWSLALARDCNHRLLNSALASSACFDLVFRDDPESALIKYSQVDFRALFPASFELRARAAHQLALGRGDRATSLIIRAQYAIPSGIPFYSLERAWLARLHMKVLLAQPSIAGIKYKSASV